MHLRKWRSFLTIVKEKEVVKEKVLKQNVHILIIQFFYGLDKFQTISKLQQYYQDTLYNVPTIKKTPGTVSHLTPMASGKISLQPIGICF